MGKVSNTHLIVPHAYKHKANFKKTNTKCTVRVRVSLLASQTFHIVAAAAEAIWYV